MNVALLVDDDGQKNTAYSIIASSFLRYAEKFGVRFVIIRPKTLSHSSFPSRIRNPCACHGMSLTATILKKEKIDLVHLQFAGNDHWGVYLMRNQIPVPFILTFQSFLPRQLSLAEPAYQKKLDYLIQNSVAITAVSHSSKMKIAEFFPIALRKFFIVPNGVDIPSGQLKMNKRCGEYLLVVGDMYSIKGTDILLFALYDLVHNGFPDLRVVFCGRDVSAGGVNNIVQKMGLSKNIQLLGPRPHSDVQKLMRDCLFLVSASREESFGMALIEAMAAGKTVVAPKTGGIPEYVVHEKNGLLFEAGSHDSLASTISRLLRDVRLRHLLEKNTPETAQRFQWEKVIAQYADIYAKTAAHN